MYLLLLLKKNRVNFAAYFSRSTPNELVLFLVDQWDAFILAHFFGSYSRYRIFRFGPLRDTDSKLFLGLYFCRSRPEESGLAFVLGMVHFWILAYSITPTLGAVESVARDLNPCLQKDSFSSCS